MSLTVVDYVGPARKTEGFDGSTYRIWRDLCVETCVHLWRHHLHCRLDWPPRLDRELPSSMNRQIQQFGVHCGFSESWFSRVWHHARSRNNRLKLIFFNPPTTHLIAKYQRSHRGACWRNERDGRPREGDRRVCGQPAASHSALTRVVGNVGPRVLHGG